MLTWQDVATLITIYEQGIDSGDYRRYNEAERMKEYSQNILEKFNAIKNARKVTIGRDIEKGAKVMPLREPLSLRATDHGIIPQECTNKGRALFNEFSK